MSRLIETGLVLYIDNKLKTDSIAQKALREKNPRALFIRAMKALVGIREKTGNNDGPMVVLLQETIGTAVREAWCMSTIQSAIAYVEVKLSVKSPIFASEHCLSVWDRTPKAQRVQRIPAPGAIIIWQHGTSMAGHTGIVTKYEGGTMRCIEGNTTQGLNPDGSIEREGGGVYETQRNSRANGTMKVVGFLKPF